MTESKQDNLTTGVQLGGPGSMGASRRWAFGDQFGDGSLGGLFLGCLLDGWGGQGWALDLSSMFARRFCGPFWEDCSMVIGHLEISLDFKDLCSMWKPAW